MKLTKQAEAKLAVVAETSIAHLRYLDMMKQSGEEIHPEDHGIMQLERAYLTLYALLIKGEIPEFAEDYFETLEH